jgi:hypothetical protein
MSLSRQRLGSDADNALRITGECAWSKAWDQKEMALLSLHDLLSLRRPRGRGARFTPGGKGFEFASLDAALNEARSRKLIHRRWHE